MQQRKLQLPLSFWIKAAWADYLAWMPYKGSKWLWKRNAEENFNSLRSQVHYNASKAITMDFVPIVEKKS